MQTATRIDEHAANMHAHRYNSNTVAYHFSILHKLTPPVLTPCQQILAYFASFFVRTLVGATLFRECHLAFCSVCALPTSCAPGLPQCSPDQLVLTALD